MQKKNLFLLLLLGSFSFVQAQKATLAGKVSDRDNNEPLIGATVLIGNRGTVTDFDGNYSIQLDPGTYRLEISYIGYQPFVQNVELKAGQSTTLNATLSIETNVLQTATVTSGKYQKPLSEVTVSLDVLRPGLIENTSKFTLDQALQKVPGVNVIDGQANIRGGSGYSYGAGSRVLLMVDDIPILQADAGFPNWDDVPIENIEQVEVVKGAASALFGSSALNGIINVRSALPRAEPETHVSVFYNHFFDPRNERLKWWDSAPFTVGGSVAHRKKYKKLDLVLGGYYLKEESFNKDTYKEYGRFNFNTNYRITDRFTIGLNGNFNQGRSGGFFYWAADTLAYIGAPTTITSRERLRFNIDPHATYFDKGGNRHKLFGRFYSVDNDNSDNQSNRSQIYYGEYQFQRRFVNIDMVITAGVVGIGTNVEAELYGDTTFTSRNLASYIQIEKKMWERLNLSTGLRYENNLLVNPGFISSINMVVPPSEERESKPVVRFGANYQLLQATYLRASWGQGYRYPTIAEKFIDTQVAAGVAVLPNPTLTSETGWTAEIGIKQGFRLSSFEGFLDIAAFWSQYQNMMEFNLTPGRLAFQAINIGDTEIKGYEIAVAGRGKFFGLPTGILIGYTNVDSRYLSFDLTPIRPGETPSIGQVNANNSSLKTDNVLKYRPRHSFKLDVETGYKGFMLGWESFYNSHLEAIDAAFNLIIRGLVKYREENNKGFFLNNLRASYQVTKGLKTSLLLNNAFNIEYSIRPGLLEGPRNLTVRADYKF